MSEVNNTPVSSINKSIDLLNDFEQKKQHFEELISKLIQITPDSVSPEHRQSPRLQVSPALPNKTAQHSMPYLSEIFH